MKDAIVGIGAAVLLLGSILTAATADDVTQYVPDGGCVIHINEDRRLWFREGGGTTVTRYCEADR